MQNEIDVGWLYGAEWNRKKEMGRRRAGLHASLGRPRNRNAAGTFDMNASLEAANLKKEYSQQRR